MAQNLPMACSQAESLKIKARLEAAIKETRATLGFIAPDLDRDQVALELAQELVRAGHRMLNGKAPGAFHCEGCQCGELEPAEFEGELARGTSNGTPVIP